MPSRRCTLWCCTRPPPTESATKRRCRQQTAHSKQLAGVWTWTAGDGWHGPDITNEFWVDLNAWVISRFAQQPWRTEPELFAEHAREVLKLGDTQARVLRDEYERLWRERRQLKQDHPS